MSLPKPPDIWYRCKLCKIVVDKKFGIWSHLAKVHDVMVKGMDEEKWWEEFKLKTGTVLLESCQIKNKDVKETGRCLGELDQKAAVDDGDRNHILLSKIPRSQITENSSINCTLCHMTFSSQPLLERHQWSSHGIIKRRASPPQQKEHEAQISIIPESFQDKTDKFVKIEFEDEEEDDELSDTNSVGINDQTFEGMEMEEAEPLPVIVERKVKCMHCGMDRKNLKNHSQSHFRCPNCQKKFTCNEAHKNHKCKHNKLEEMEREILATRAKQIAEKAKRRQEWLETDARASNIIATDFSCVLTPNLQVLQIPPQMLSSSSSSNTTKESSHSTNNTKDIHHHKTPETLTFHKQVDQETKSSTFSQLLFGSKLIPLPNVALEEGSNSNSPLMNNTQTNFYKCTFCCETRRTQHLLNNHLASHDRVKKTPHSCFLCCGVNFISDYSLRRHLNRAHFLQPTFYSQTTAPYNTFWCHLCNFEFRYLKRLNTHIGKMHRKEPFEKQDDDDDEFMPPIIQSTKSLSNSVPLVDQPPAPKRILLVVMKKSDQVQKAAKISSPLFVCAYCGDKFTQRILLYCHVEKEHEMERALPESGNTEFYCRICQMYFSSSVSLGRHSRTFHQPTNENHRPQPKQTNFNCQTVILPNTKNVPQIFHAMPETNNQNETEVIDLVESTNDEEESKDSTDSNPRNFTELGIDIASLSEKLNLDIELISGM